MASARLVLVLVAAFFATADATGERMRLNVNPIRRVVTMLQMMQHKVEAQGAKEQELFEKFMCYCKNGVGDLKKSITDAEDKVEQLTAGIEETSATLKQLQADIKKAKDDRKDAEDTVGKAKELRAKEAKAFAKASSDMKTNIAAMSKATIAIEKGMGDSFLQTNAASEIKKLSITMDLSESDRDVLASFLAGGSKNGEEYDPASGEIVGILKQMKETMEGELAEAEAAEEKAIKDFDALLAAKTKQIETLTKEIETKMVREGEAAVLLTQEKEDLADTSKSLTEDKKFLQDLAKDCATKEDEKAANDKMRADELLALADTIKILNDDDALDLFKKTLPTPSLLQLQVSSKQVKDRALKALAGKKHHKDFRLNLIAMALHGKKVSFDKVLGMIDDMIHLLGEEQKGDNEKKAYCEKNLDETEDELKELGRDISDLDKAIAEHKEGIKKVIAELQALTEGIKNLDKAVADATKQRKEENAEYEETMQSDGAAKELLAMAKNRLAKFYSPKLYKPAPKRQLSEEERITVNMGGTLAPTAAPGGIAGTGVTAAFAQYQAEATDENVGFLQIRAASKKAAPPPPPETAGAYKKSGEESNGVMAMIDILQGDLDKEMQTMKVEEKEAQKEYEQFIKDSADKRADDSRSISDKEGVKVELQENTLKLEQEQKDKKRESLAKIEELGSLHKECDWLLANYGARKEARANEVENLKSAKAVLNGADYSFLQTVSITRHIG